MTARDGRRVVRQGDAGDRFYVVADGDLEVIVDGQQVGTLGPGDYVGEIALLRDVPRTATVRTLTESELHALEREPFVSAVTGYSQSEGIANVLVAARLGSSRARTLSF